MGALPAVGQWVQLAVPAAQVGLEGRTLSGMAYTLYGGRATWDYAGKRAAGTTTYQITGTVTSGGAALSGVTFTGTGGVSCTNSDAAGNYACTVPQGWTGTVTPSLSGYTFTPTSRSYTNVAANQTAQNYTATLVTYQVSGTVTLSGSALSGVTFTAPGAVSCTISDATGSYSCTVPQGWTGTVTPSLSGYTFTPTSRSYTNVAANQTAQNYAATIASATTVWVEDAVPVGATTASDGGDAWNWISANPTPYSGTKAHQSSTGAGEHQHYFYNATATLPVAVGDTLFAYVYLDPANPPSELMLQWYDGSWEHRAYWGANLIPWGTNGTVSRRSMGALPAVGQWVQLAVPAAQVGLEGRTLSGMAYTLYGGRATWDYAGKTAAGTTTYQITGTVTLSGAALSGVSFAATGGVSCTNSDATGSYACTVPQGWTGTVTPSLSGYSFTPTSRSYTNVAANQTAQNYTAALVTYQVSGTVTSSGAALSGVTFTATGGVSCTNSDAAGNYACTIPQGWTGTVTPSLSGYTFTPTSRSYSNVAANQTAQDYAATINSTTTVWVEDAVPAGATTASDGGDAWNWISANPTPYSGGLAQQSALVGGEHQHYFYNATATLPVAVGDTLFAYVYLDPANPPSEVMLQWYDGSWEHRAYWGANLIPWGANGTVSRRSMGALPATGQWVQLAVPAAQVGLEGRTLSGMAFTLYGGRANWDYAGKTAAAVPATAWVEDATPAGATTGSDGGDVWNWISVNPAPYSGTLAHQSALVAGEHQHYFYNATATLPVAVGDTLFAYVYLDPDNPPSEVMLQWYDGTWEHRAYWGANLIPWGTDGTVSLRSMGALPAAGQWVKLAVPAAQVGLEGRTLNGMAYTLYGGRATWDYAGK
jgi:acyl dehydratase